MEAVTRENYKWSAPTRIGILAWATVRAKKVVISVSCEIARVAILGQITMVARENFRMSAPVRAGIFACAKSYSKKVALSKSREITRIEYLREKTNIESGRMRKL